MAPFPEERTTQSILIGCISSEVQGHLNDSLLFFLRYNNTKCSFLVPDTFTHNLKGHLLNVCFIPKTFRLFLKLRAFQKFQNCTGCHTYTAQIFYKPY